MKKLLLILLCVPLIGLTSLSTYSQSKCWGDVGTKIDFQELELEVRETKRYYPIRSVYGEDSLDIYGNEVYGRYKTKEHLWRVKETFNLFSGIAFIEYPNGELQYEGYFNEGIEMHHFQRCWDINGNPISCMYMSYVNGYPKMQIYPLEEVQFISTLVDTDTTYVQLFDEYGDLLLDLYGNIVYEKIFDLIYQDLAYYNGEIITGIVVQKYFNNIVKSAKYILSGDEYIQIDYYYTGEVKKCIFPPPSKETLSNVEYEGVDWILIHCYDKKGNPIECE